MIVATRTTAVCAIEIDAERVVAVRFNPAVKVGRREIIENLSAHRDLTELRKHRVLVDARGVRGMTREAMQTAASDAVVSAIERCAVVVGSPVTVMVSRFFALIVKLPCPIRMFRSEAAARAWLLEGQGRK